MVLFFKRNPFLFVLLALLTGIFLGELISFEFRQWLLISFFVAFILQTLVLFKKSIIRSYRYRWIVGALFVIGVFSFGLFNSLVKRPLEPDGDSQCSFQAEIVDVVGYSENYIRCKLNVFSDATTNTPFQLEQLRNWLRCTKEKY